MIAAIKWLGLRCRITVEGQYEDLAVDVRTKAADVATSLAGGPKKFGADNTVSIPVIVDDAEGTAAVIVLLDSSGRVMQKRPTSVGGEE
jgi:hypothetical protein